MGTKICKKIFQIMCLYIISLSLERFLSYLQKRPFLLRPKVSLSVSPYCPMPYNIHFPLCNYAIYFSSLQMIGYVLFWIVRPDVKFE